MIDPTRLLFIKPRRASTAVPLIDAITRRMTAALRRARLPGATSRGVHRCVCGALSTAHDYILPLGQQTNALCIHYLAHHRDEVPAAQIRRVLRLPEARARPTRAELQGPDVVLPREMTQARRRLGKGRLSALAAAGFDLRHVVIQTLSGSKTGENAAWILAILAHIAVEHMPGWLEAMSVTQPRCSGRAPAALSPDTPPRETWRALGERICQDGDPELRCSAVAVLVRLVGRRRVGTATEEERECERIRAILIESARRDPDARVRRLAMESLAVDHAAAVMPAALLAQYRSEFGRGVALPDEERDVFLEAVLKDEADPDCRRLAVRAWIDGPCAPPSTAHALLVHIALDDSDATCRTLALCALARAPTTPAIRAARDRLVPRIVDALPGGGDPEARGSLLDLLLGLRVERGLLVPRIVRALGDRDSSVRLWAARVLCRDVRLAALAVDTLRVAVQDANPNVQYSAAAALERVAAAGSGPHD